MAERILELLLASSLRGSILALFALLLAPLVRRALGPNGAHFLWVAALAAFLWPWPPQTPLSAQNLVVARPPQPALTAPERSFPQTPATVRVATPVVAPAISAPEITSLSPASPLPAATPRRAIEPRLALALA